jgi:hypothetical protein
VAEGREYYSKKDKASDKVVYDFLMRRREQGEAAAAASLTRLADEAEVFERAREPARARAAYLDLAVAAVARAEQLNPSSRFTSRLLHGQNDPPPIPSSLDREGGGCLPRSEGRARAAQGGEG